MSNRYRSLNRIGIALAIAAALVAVRAGVKTFAAPTATFTTLPDLRFNQGQNVTVAFAADGFPTGLTYTAEGLPPGLSMTMGVDTLGHEVGLMTGTLAPDTETTSGSEGVYNVRLHADDGAVSNFFAVDVSHWNKGDVFVGAGQWVYQVYREDGTFKTDVTVPDDSNLTYGSTTGCAVNWNTGEVWATNFDDLYPALNVITRHQGANPLPFTDPTRRLSTERYGVAGATTPFPGNMSSLDIDPESVTFDNAGNMYVGHSFGFWNDNGDVSDVNGTATILANPSGDGWVYVDAAGQPLLDANGGVIYDSTPISPAGFFERWTNTPLPINILDANGFPIPVPLQGGMDLHRYAPDVNGDYHQTDRQFFDLHYGHTGIDTLDMLSDQKTMNYTSEDWYLYRYDVSTSTQLPVVGSVVPGESRPITTRSLYGIRALPPGDGSGGYLVVNEYNVDRLDETGQIIQSYDFRDDPDYPGDPDLGWAPRDVNGWFAIAIAPDGRTFWAATRQDVFHFDIASGAIIGSKIRATIGTLHTNAELAGLCVMDEYRAAQEVCGPTGLGNNIDDDHDGTIDEGCFKVEICSALRPGDDDGDGLVDYNDPDCGAVPAQQCVTGGPTDNSVAGICDRADYEGDNVVVPGVPLPCSGDYDCSSWTFSYTATGLPPGLTMNPTTGEVTGVPLFSIVNPNSDLSAPVVHHVTVNGSWQQTGQPAAAFSNTFDWTIYNRNRVPTAVDDGPQSVLAGASFSFDVRANDSDIDGDAISVLSFTQPAPGEGSVAQVGQNLVYTAPASGFGGTTTFTYKLQDSYNPAAVSNDATVTVVVNGPPVAVNDFYTAEWNTTLNVPLALGVIRNPAGRDSDPEGMPISVVPVSVTQPANGTVSVNADGSFSYTPNTGFFGTDTYTYQVTDGTLSSNVATVTIVVHRPPVGVDDFYTSPINVPVVLSAPGIMSNDSDPEGNQISVVLGSLGNVIHGTLAVQTNGAIVYTPNLNFAGIETFNYRVTNGYYESSNTTVTIKINDLPVAVNDAFTTNEDTPVNATLASNDTASFDGGNVWTKTSNPSNGTATVNPGGTFVYTPNANYHGTDSFNYTLCDADNECSNATVTITITSVNDVPVAVNDAFTTNEDTPVSGSLTGNDTPSGDGGNVWTKASNPSNGSATVNADGTFTYTPNANYFGTDSFTYTVCDVDNDCATATVTITIAPVNDVPLAVNDAFSTTEDVAVSGTLIPNDTPSPDGGNTWAKTSNPSNGTATVNADGTFTYTPNAGYSGTDTFNYTLCDVDEDCAPATVTITILAKRLDITASPVCIADAPYVSFTITPVNFTPVTGATATLKWKDSTGAIVQTTVLPWTNTSQPLTGQVLWPGAVVDTNGAAIDWPGWLIQGGLWVQGSDGFENTRPTSTVEISVNPTAVVSVSYPPATPSCNAAPTVNHPPVAVDDFYTTAEDTPVTVPVNGIMVNDTDPENGPLVVSLPIVSQPSHGAVTQNADGSLTYSPALNYSGTDSYTYKVTDAAGNFSNVATVHITITPINDVPVAVDDAFTAAPGVAVNGTLTGNDTPSGDGGNVWTKTSNPANGTATVNADGTFSYTPNASFLGTDSFTYQICDVNGDCSTATVTITVVCPPVTTPTALVRHNVMFNDGSRTQGNVQVMASGNNTFNSNATLVGDIFFAGTPTVQVNGSPAAFGGTVDGTGAATPSGYYVTVNSGASLGRIVRRTDPIALPTVAAPPAPTGTRSVSLNSPTDNPGSFATLRDLTLNSNVGPIAVPPGNYGTFSANTNTAFTLGVVGATTPSVYTFQSLNMNGDSKINVVGPVVVTVGNQVSLNSTAGDVAHLDWLTLKIASGALNLNSAATFFYGYVVVPNGALNVNSGATLVGGLVADSLTVNSNGRIILQSFPSPCVVDARPVAVDDAFTTPQNTAVSGALADNDTASADGGNVWTKTSNPSNGAATVNANGTFTYTPNTGFSGSDTFTYKVCDADLDCATATVTITVTRVNQVPVAVDDDFTTAEDTAVHASVTGNDTPSGDGGNVWALVTPTTNGTVTVNADGTFVYTPNANFNGVDTFTYDVCDVDEDCAGATVTITITPVDDAPLAVNDAFTTPEDTPVSGSLTGNDTPSGDGGNVWTKTSNPSNGSVTVNADGTFTYTPNANFSGTDSFTYQVCDADGDCAPATATITITAVDDAPVAVNDAFTTPEDTPVSGSLTGNDTLSGDGGNVWSKVSNPAHGTATVNADGTFTYTPAANFNGTDSFTYQVCDVDGDCSTATVAITITSVNEVPLAANDSYTTPMNTAVTGHAQINDTASPDGGNVWSVVSAPTTGTVSLLPSGDFTYTPATGFTGTATFSYKVCDVDGDCATATVSILIATACEPGPFTTFTQGGWGAKPNGGNPGALLAANFASVYPTGFVQIGTSAKYLKFTSAVAVQNFLPAGGSPSTLYWSATNPTWSSAGVFAGQVLALQLSVDFSDAGVKKAGLKNQVVASGELAGYTVGQVLALANTAIAGGALPSGVTISDLNGVVDAINNNYDNGTTDQHFLNDDPNCGVNRPPVAVNDAYTTRANTALAIGTPGILVNDSDPDGSAITVTLVSNPAHGTLAQNANGSFTYTPAVNYVGLDAYTYKVKDAAGAESNVATVTITITNNPPVAQNDSYTTPKNTPVTIAVIGNDSDPDGDTLTVTANTAPSHGAVTRTGNTFVYTPANGYVGTDTYTYTITDGFGLTSTATVTITIVDPNHPPVAVNDATTTLMNTPVTITVLGNDSDPDGDPLTVISNTTASHGTVVRTGNTFVYTPATGYIGTDTYTYTISDGRGGTATATVTITISTSEVCYVGSAAPQISARQTVTRNADGTITIRTYLSRNFNDNTYGANAIGWSHHNFSDLVGSDKAQIALYDTTGNKVMEFKIDYISASSSVPSGYTTLGVSGGDGGMISGSASDVVGAKTSLSTNFNTFGYVLTTNSPATTSSYATNSSYPNWIWDVWYEATVKASAFGAAGFGYPRLASVHASPSKTGSNTEPLTLTTCGATVNHPPVAVNDSYPANKNTVLIVSTPGILGNDSDPDGDDITAQLVTNPTHGTVVQNADGSFRYTPTTNYVGTDSYTYKVKDASGLYSNVATVTINISSVACALIAVNDLYTTNQGHALTILPGGILKNDEDPYAKGLTVSQVNGSASKVGATVSTSHGTVKVNADGSFTYTPSSSFSGTDSFTYQMKSKYNGSTSTATVRISVANHYDGDGDDHDQHHNGHRDGDGCEHDKALDHHYAGDGCDHDRKRNGHHDGDGCAHDRDTHRHFDGDGCDHDRGRTGHYAGDDCEHSRTVKSHYDGDGDDHDRRRSGHKDGDGCEHDKATHHHNDGDGCDHDLRKAGHYDGDKCDHDRDDHGHNDGDGCDHDRGRNGHYDGDGCEHDRHARGDDDDDNACVVTTGGGEHHSGGHDDEHHSGDYCDHDRKRKGHYDGDGCEHDKVAKHYDGDGCDHDRGRSGHRDGDGCEHDRSQRNDRDRNYGRGGDSE